ncbi:MAG TPA: amidohydrolase family protein [Verrucomicrobiae bacterium]
MSVEPKPCGISSLASRREFLKAAAFGASMAVFGAGATPALASESGGITDVNVSLGRWPVRRMPLDEPDRLVAKLRSRGVVQAWTGSLEGLLHKNLAAVNERLAEDCRRHGRGRLLPFGSINPSLPEWQEDLRHCVEVHRFKGIRLHPNYHGYRLDNPAFARLLQLAARHRLIVQVSLVMEDERMMHPLLRVEPVDTKPLVELARQTPGLRLVLLNALRTLRGEPLRKLTSAADICVEISMLEGVGAIASLLEQVPSDRVVFGSHSPLFYFEAAELKLKESPLTQEQLRRIRFANAQRLLSTSPV